LRPRHSGIPGCWERDVIGHTAAAPPSNPMNSRSQSAQPLFPGK